MGVTADTLAGYEAIRAALVADQASTVTSAARALATSAQDPAIATAAVAVAAASDLAGARRAFSELSRLVVLGLVASSSAPKVVAYHCPMFDGYGWWIQPKAGIANPYMGQAMPACGAEMSLRAAAKEAALPP